MTEQTKGTLEERLNNWMPQRELAGIVGVSSDTLKRWGDAVNLEALHPHRPLPDVRPWRVLRCRIPGSCRPSCSADFNMIRIAFGPPSQPVTQEELGKKFLHAMSQSCLGQRARAKQLKFGSRCNSRQITFRLASSGQLNINLS